MKLSKKKLNRITCWVIVALGLSLSSPGFAQSRAKLKEVDQRLQRVERVLDQSLLELLQQVESQQREIRVLRGELESQANALAKIQKSSRELYLDTDQRLTELESDSSSGLVDPDLDNLLDPDAPIGSDELGSNENKTGSDQEKAKYKVAYDLLAAGKNQEAVAAFQSFLRDYPDGLYSDNAWYWRGEALYANRSFDEAIESFLQVIDFFPSSRKVADARLKVGFAQFESKRYKEARATLIAVRDAYPGRSAGNLADKRLQLMDESDL